MLSLIGSTLIAGYLGLTAGACYLFYLSYRAKHIDDLEKRSALFALKPLLLAERDREYLKQLRRNRDEEAKLMANVEGWEVGTYYGEPIYYNLPKNTLIEPNYADYTVHAKFKDYAKRAHLILWS